MARKSVSLSRGYGEGKERFLKGVKYNMSCYTCGWYFTAPGDDHEVCQNSDVLKFDIVMAGTNIYCSKWKPHTSEGITAKSLMKGMT